MDLQSVKQNGYEVRKLNTIKNLLKVVTLCSRGFSQDKSRSIKTHLRLPSNGSDSGSSRLGHKAPVSRIMLPSSVYLDMLNLAYFAVYNGFGVKTCDFSI